MNSEQSACVPWRGCSPLPVNSDSERVPWGRCSLVYSSRRTYLGEYVLDVDPVTVSQHQFVGAVGALLLFLLEDVGVSRSLTQNDNKVSRGWNDTILSKRDQLTTTSSQKNYRSE